MLYDVVSGHLQKEVVDQGMLMASSHLLVWNDVIDNINENVVVPEAEGSLLKLFKNPQVFAIDLAQPCSNCFMISRYLPSTP